MSSLSTVSPSRRAVLADLFPASKAATVALVVGGATVIGLLAQVAVPLPFTPVPLTGQTLGVLLVAAALGLRRGAAAALLYGTAGLAGVPWFTGGSAGWQAASFGYVIGFVAAAAVVGAFAERGWDRGVGRIVLVMVGADALVLLIGTIWLAGAVHVGPEQAIHMGVTPFVVGDLAKIAVAAGLLPTTWRLVGDRR